MHFLQGFKPQEPLKIRTAAIWCKLPESVIHVISQKRHPIKAKPCEMNTGSMGLLWIPVLSSLVFVKISWTRPIDGNQHLKPEDVELAEIYLKTYYGLKQTDRGDRFPQRRTRSVSAMEMKIREMQNFFGLRETGGLDSSTLSVMKLPRCGVPDVENFGFYPFKPKWKNHNVTYKIAKYTPDMSKEDVEKAFHSALKMWREAAPLRFTQVTSGSADIVLTFARKTHGDFFPFDGPGGVLAHAFQPGERMGGDVHFDEDETWTAGNQGYNLFAVAAHEIGHSLGLSHSKDRSAIMYPNYRYHSSTQHALSKDDMLGIQMLYGKPNQKVEIQSTAPQNCDPDFSFDAAAIIDDSIVLLKNRHMWMRTINGSYWNQLTEGLIKTYLPGINDRIDAAYDIPSKGEAYIFTGQKYWVVEKLKSRSRVGSIQDYGFPSRVTHIDAAVHISEQGKTVFFTGPFYYRFDEVKRQLEYSYPRLIQRNSRGLPRRVDAAFRIHGSIFLLSGPKSYKYDLKQKRVVKIIPGNSWLGCRLK